MNKRGDSDGGGGLGTVATIILIVIALAFIIYFLAGGSSVFSNILYTFTPTNVDTIKQACQQAALGTSTSEALCCQIREIKYNKDQKKPILGTCYTEKTNLGLTGVDIVCGVAADGDCSAQICEQPSKSKCDSANEESINKAKKFEPEGEVIKFGMYCCEVPA